MILVDKDYQETPTLLPRRRNWMEGQTSLRDSSTSLALNYHVTLCQSPIKFPPGDDSRIFYDESNRQVVFVGGEKREINNNNAPPSLSFDYTKLLFVGEEEISVHPATATEEIQRFWIFFFCWCPHVNFVQSGFCIQRPATFGCEICTRQEVLDNSSEQQPERSGKKFYLCFTNLSVGASSHSL